MTGLAPSRVLEIETPHGPARAHVHDPKGRPRTTVVLGHGAGGGIEARDLVALAATAPRDGHRVVLVEMPWRVAGKKVAAAPKVLDVGWAAVLARLAAEGVLAGRLVTGGRSAGARVACRTAVATAADAVLLLAFPLHPPGRPERMRDEELRGRGVPALVVQGERDPFGGPDEVRAAVPGVPVVAIPGADHGFAVARSAPVTQDEAVELVAQAVLRGLAEWAAGTRR